MSYQDELPPKAEIFDHWKDKFRELGLFIDWGEPSCWSCGFHYGAKYDIKQSDAPLSDILKGWNDIPLQRCHIVPRSLRGSDTPENLFLMCRECHDLAPNTNAPEIFFEWVRAQCSWRRDNQRLDHAFEAFSLGEPERRKLLAVMESEGFRSWINGRIGLHWPQSNYPSAMSRLTPATLVGIASYYQRTVRKAQ